MPKLAPSRGPKLYLSTSNAEQWPGYFSDGKMAAQCIGSASLRSGRPSTTRPSPFSVAKPRSIGVLRVQCQLEQKPLGGGKCMSILPTHRAHHDRCNDCRCQALRYKIGAPYWSIECEECFAEFSLAELPRAKHQDSFPSRGVTGRNSPRLSPPSSLSG